MTVTDGLISNTVLYAKLVDDQLFMIEPTCIQILDINTEKIIKTIALPTKKSANIYDIWKEDSSIYISTNKSLYSIETKNIFNNIVPVNHLLSVTVDSASIPINKQAILPYQKNHIEFNIVSPSIIYPENTYFKYRLLGGTDVNWKETKTNESSITFASLKPGSYTFEAYAVNFQNNNAKPILFSFKILKPWWQKWLFISFIMLCVLLIIYYIISHYLKSLKKANDQKLEKLNLTSQLRKSQLSTIIAQMNPHFIFNILNTIQGLIYTNDKNRATIYIGKFSELVRNILHNSHLQEITLREEIEQLTLYLDLEKIRFENDFNILIEVDTDLDKDNILIPPILIQPFVENAIVHGLFHKKGKKNLHIQFKKEILNDYIKIIINDNGIGRDNSNKLNLERKKHTSFAVSAIKKRIDLINQTLKKQICIEILDNKDDQENATGTTIVLSIPINQEQLFIN
ncbi:MAG: histidine kinase [Pedobacter sp.]|nr:histidine kinase [Chitinophagaceae bacterium]